MVRYQEGVPLSTLTTMRLGGLARYVVEIRAQEDLVSAVRFAREQDLPWFVLGDGSNVVAHGDFNGLIILNRIKGFDKVDEDDRFATYEIGAGEVWDSVVERLAKASLSGVEAMSGIPGRAGATPVQNVGAYGQEIADVLTKLEAYDTDSDRFVTLRAGDCGFSYRSSVLKSPETRHHIISSMTLRLNREPPKPPFYPSLSRYLSDNNITDFTPAGIRAAVIAVRANVLPDPQDIASAGSFFKNPLVDRAMADRLLEQHPDAPHWEMPGNRTKLAAGWLIDQAGLKSYSAHGLQIYPKNALVVTNLSATSAEALEKFRSEVVAIVKDKFEVTLEQEPENL